MQAINNAPVFTGKNLKITSEINKGRQYLYNDVSAILKKNPMTAVFTNEKILIEMPSDSLQMQEKLMGDLTKAGINFDTIV